MLVVQHALDSSKYLSRQVSGFVPSTGCVGRARPGRSYLENEDGRSKRQRNREREGAQVRAKAKEDGLDDGDGSMCAQECM